MLKRLRFFLLGLAVILMAYTGVTTMPYGSNQIMAHGDFVAQVGNSTYSWKVNPGWASTDGQGTTYTEFTTDVNTSGCVTPATGASTLVSKSYADGCKYVSSSHTPILANNTFSAGSFTSWADAGGCTTGTNLTDQDGDTGYAAMSSGGTGVGCVAALKQTFTVSAPLGTPTSQSGSLYYIYTQANGVGSFCKTPGSVSGLAIKTNGTTIYSTAPAVSSTWSQISFTPTLVNGSNTFEIDLTLNDASAYSTSSCLAENFTAENFKIDHIVLTATY